MDKIIRKVNAEKGIVQITTFDERWYARPNENKVTGLPEYDFVPSVTWIAGYYPKGIQFYKWLADKGWDEAEAIKQAAGDKGSKIHLAIADILSGKEVKMDAKYMSKKSGEEEPLTADEYEAVIWFIEWLKDENPEILAFEYVVWEDAYKYAGTIDLKCRMKDGFIWAVDIKSGQSIWKEYELQVSAYRHADLEVQKTAILQVNYKKNKIKKYKFTEIPDKFPLFLNARNTWKEENEGVVPSQKDYPLSLKWEKPKEVVEEPLINIKVEEEKPTIKKDNARNKI